MSLRPEWSFWPPTSGCARDGLRGSSVVAHVVHPGTGATNLVRESGAIGIAWRLMAPLLRTAEQGADTPLHVALAPDWATVTGAYVKDRVVVRPNPRALDPVLAARVEAMTQAPIEATIDSERPRQFPR